MAPGSQAKPSQLDYYLTVIRHRVSPDVRVYCSILFKDFIVQFLLKHVPATTPALFPRINYVINIELKINNF